jgi:hypothetical protein
MKAQTVNFKDVVLEKCFHGTTNNTLVDSEGWIDFNIYGIKETDVEQVECICSCILHYNRVYDQFIVTLKNGMKMCVLGRKHRRD